MLENDMPFVMKENSVKIQELFKKDGIQKYSFFGDGIPRTSSGIAKINVIVDTADIFIRSELQNNLSGILNNLSVNIYTEKYQKKKKITTHSLEKIIEELDGSMKNNALPTKHF